ncbi:hypothetical protein COX58_03560 [archaeon CG_4_10_14_0_2_um_filter_Archaea_38_6]|nr:MAG: hypothetical protein COS83_01345 [archaeon CG07_land_8_20_14_0_80_38_8]PIU89584.1 MAG: hypothetical protein COS64_00665 [archaeon CG06_land_8_20_14_3_00_37_11]PJA21685.1 MAG: hypothetical protein COX58_03560 [archaeon CG_4_10_14_0_2_um_filter_Archaea_38_6]
MENINFEQASIEDILRNIGGFLPKKEIPNSVLKAVEEEYSSYFLGEAGKREFNKYWVEEELNNQHFYE